MENILNLEQKKLQLISLIAQMYDYELLNRLEKQLLDSEKDWWNSHRAKSGHDYGCNITNIESENGKKRTSNSI